MSKMTWEPDKAFARAEAMFRQNPELKGTLMFLGHACRLDNMEYVGTTWSKSGGLDNFMIGDRNMGRVCLKLDADEVKS